MNEQKPDEKYARGWNLLGSNADPTPFGQWLRSPPVWFSGVILGVGTIALLVAVLWLFAIFISAILQLNSMTASVKITASDGIAVEALKNVIAATGGVLGGLVATVLIVWRTLLNQRQTRACRHLGDSQIG